jgi:hypothetical protein
MTPLATRIALLILAGQALVSGLWATVSPRAFYDDFPGLGRAWVAIDGPYNEHLVRDYGALNLALAVVTVAALVTLARGLVTAAGGAWLAWSVPHLVYHVRHRDVFEGADAPAALGAIALGGALALLLLIRPPRARSGAATPSGTADPEPVG